MNHHTEIARLWGDLNDEERSAIRNLIAPAILVEEDDDPKIAEAAQALLWAVALMLRSRALLSAALEAPR